MKILIVGGGGREHALGQALAKDSRVTDLYFAPGNGGTSALGTNVDIGATDLEALVDFAQKEGIDYTVCGPEDPLAGGLVDLFEDRGLEIFGPRKEAAQLEGSKDFAKDFCLRHGIRTAGHKTCETKEEAEKAALDFLKRDGTVVIKADGLAAGKGVGICQTSRDISDFLKRVFDEDAFKSSKVLVEEFVKGFEMSLMAFCDSNTLLPLATVKDHKEVYDQDRGPNTGGMGTYSPNLQALPYMERIQEEVLDPFLAGLKKDGMDFRGMVFIGLMIGDGGIHVLEFNTRFGDPETQSLLERLDTPLLDLLMATSRGQLDEVDLVNNDKRVVSLTLASEGYPGSYKTGFPITGLDPLEGVTIFHAGTKEEGGQVLTSGGRVLTVTARADSFKEAMDLAYAQAEKIDFEGKYYRRDIGPMVHRVYVRRKEGFNENETLLKEDLKRDLGLDIEDLAIYLRYDLQGLDEDELALALDQVLADPGVEEVYSGQEALDLQASLASPLVVKMHQGQFDQKEDLVTSAMRVLLEKDGIQASLARVYDLGQEDIDMEQVRSYLINPVDEEEGDLLGIPTSLDYLAEESLDNPLIEGFRTWDEGQIDQALKDYGLAMSREDLALIRDHFAGLGRDINITELMVLDTYWSDHCRHTTFNTQLEVDFLDGVEKTILEAFDLYIKNREEVSRTKPISLMDLGTMAARLLKARGIRTRVEDSEEVNACSIHVDVDVDIDGEKKTLPYLLMFKNETHNHPTELEPFGGASTCLGGCIRDPLSGRGYVYQALRVTGAGDPRQAYEDTLEGKLAQRQITKEAARGYSSYGNQIGVPGGLLREVYHPGYVAKRMELGALVAAAPLDNVLRAQPEPGDLVLLLGGRTGRDGIGGATGSSQDHGEAILETASAEVQKGNAPVESRVIRLFARPEISKKIKRSNDFGAGGVSVAIGELADGLRIQLDRVPLKYPGLKPMEIALSESQERMALVIDPEDLETFRQACREENVEMTQVAEVTSEGRMVMYYGDQVICDLDRAFIDSSGAPRRQEVTVAPRAELDLKVPGPHRPEDLEGVLGDINVLSQKNLAQAFDATVGRGTVLSPLGGKNQVTPVQAMAALIPVREGTSQTASLMSYGFNPDLTSKNPFVGGYYAVVESLARLVATGGRIEDAYLSFQEFFESLGQDPGRWAKPFEALLGAYKASLETKTCPIGGKDSMSGSFKDLDVPPTLISFAVAHTDRAHVVSPELKEAGSSLGLIRTKREGAYLDMEDFLAKAMLINDQIQAGNVLSATAIGREGTLAALYIAAEGNDLGFELDLEDLYSPLYGDFILEVKEDFEGLEKIGRVTEEDRLVNGTLLDKASLSKLWKTGLDGVFPPENLSQDKTQGQVDKASRTWKSKDPIQEPMVLIPVFPGSLGEKDLAAAFKAQGARVEEVVFNDSSLEDIGRSNQDLAQKISQAHVLALPSAVSLPGEPGGSAAYIRAMIEKDPVSQAIGDLLERGGLVLGLGQSFKALIEAGYFGDIEAGLSLNPGKTHIASLVKVRAQTLDSPWLSLLDPDKSYSLPISAGEGRFYADPSSLSKLEEEGRLALTYEKDPTGSTGSIQALLSPCKRVLGMTGHPERLDEDLMVNIPDLEVPPIIQGGIEYFKR